MSPLQYRGSVPEASGDVAPPPQSFFLEEDDGYDGEGVDGPGMPLDSIRVRGGVHTHRHMCMHVCMHDVLYINVIGTKASQIHVNKTQA